MAKRRRLTKSTTHERSGALLRSADMPVARSSFTAVGGLNLYGVAIAMLAGGLVYVMYFPSDSVAVEQGDALWFSALCLVIATLTHAWRAWTGPGHVDPTCKVPAEMTGTAVGDMEQETEPLESVGAPIAPSGQQLIKRAEVILQVLPWLLAAWMMLAAIATSPPGNLRGSTNEAWLWFGAASLFTASRYLFVSISVRRRMIGLILIAACGLAVHGMHQYFVSLPANRAEYQRDPDAVLQKAMIDAPPGSAERMVFENRLMDGGPTATFALANSLAAVLLVGVVLAAGVLVVSWTRLASWQRVGWAVAAVMCAGCLLAARSRSATLSMWVAFALILIAATGILARRRRVLLFGLLGLLILAFAGTAFLAVFGNREWFEQAPASLAFRFQYWRSTWQLVLDHPLFGAGPGNFQMMYERYRESTATEQIAEPHNLLVETLASGGFLGLAALLLTAVSGTIVFLLRRPLLSETAASGASRLPRWVWLGAIVSFLMIWLFGWISRRPPDLDASLYVVPAVLLMSWWIGGSVDRISRRDLDVVVAIAILALGIHLMISGGWTVPGVAILIWIGAGMLTREQGAAASGDRTAHSLIGTVSVTVVGLALLFFLWGWSLRPVERQRLWMTRATDAQLRGQLPAAEQALLRAVESDPWSPQATLWLADFYRWDLVLKGDRAPARRQWQQTLEATKQRAGEDPAVFRMIGAQQIHLFQRFGRPTDLDAAAEAFQTALGWSPANEWLFAQMAAIAGAQGQTQAAADYAATAESLSRQGGNIERALSRQMIYIPRKLGVAAERGPVRMAADQLLFEPKPSTDRKSAT